jgi:hypothetical protein
MRGVANPHNDQPCFPSLHAAHSGSLTLKEPIPEDLAALGQEVVELVPRKQRGSLDAFRQAANALSCILKTTGVRVKPKVLYYTALRVKWVQDNVSW